MQWEQISTAETQLFSYAFSGYAVWYCCQHSTDMGQLYKVITAPVIITNKSVTECEFTMLPQAATLEIEVENYKLFEGIIIDITPDRWISHLSNMVDVVTYNNRGVGTISFCNNNIGYLLTNHEHHYVKFAIKIKFEFEDNGGGKHKLVRIANKLATSDISFLEKQYFNGNYKVKDFL